MPRSRKKEEQRRESSAATLPEQPVVGEGTEREPDPIPDVLVHINYSLLGYSAVFIAICLLVLFFAHGFQLRRNAGHLKDLADAAEANGDPAAAIKHLTRYLGIQRERFDPGKIDGRQSETLVRLATLLSEHADSRSELELAFRYFEEVLRSDPERHAERRRLVGVCMKLGRYRDALQHLDQLFHEDPQAAGNVHLLLLEAQSHARQRDFAKAQQSFCRLIATDPDDCEPYLALAGLVAREPDELWYRDSEDPSADDAQFVVRAFPLGQTEDGPAERDPRLALKTVDAILGLLVEHGHPTWDAHRRRALFLSSVGWSLDAAPVPKPLAESRAALAVEDRDADADGVLSAAEAGAASVPAFSDINHDGSIDAAELAGTLEQGGLLRRLEEAESSIREAVSLIEETGNRDAQSTTFSTAAEVYLALAEALQFEDYDRSKASVGHARDAAERAVLLSDRSAEALLAQARLELRLLSFEADEQSRQHRLGQAEALLSDARDILVAAADTPDEDSAEKASDDPNTLLIDVEWTLADVLLAQVRNQHSGDDGLVSRVREEIIPSLRDRGAPSYLVEFLEGQRFLVENQWHEAERALQTAAAELGSSNDLLRRIGLLRAHCAQKLADSQSHVARALAVHQAEPSWGRGRIELAQAYEDSGNLDAALAEYGRYGAHPDVTPKYARLLIQRERNKPFDQRNWRQIENVLLVLDGQEQNAAQAPVMRSEVLLQQAITEQQAYERDKGAGIVETAGEKLQQADDLLADAVDQFPDDITIRTALSDLVLQRFDFSVEQRVQRCGDILRRAREEIGDSVPLRLAMANATALLPLEEAVPSLQELHDDNPEFSPQDRAALLSGLGRVYARRGKNSLATDAYVEAAQLVPTEITYAQAALGQIMRYIFENAGKIGDQQSNWDAMLATLAEIEGEAGPYTAYYRATYIVMTAAGDPGLLNDADGQKKPGEARTLLMAAQRKLPRWSAIPRMLGELELLRFRHAGRQDTAARFQQAAVSHLEDAVERGDLSEYVVGLLVEYYLQERREPDARRLLDKVAREQPQALSGKLATLAWMVESRSDERNLAIDTYIKQAVGPRKGAAAKIRSALMLMGRGETGPKVEELLVEACELEPASPGPWEWIVRYYAERTRYIAARDQIDEAEQALPADPPFLKPRTIARCYRTLRRNDAANREQWNEQAEQHYLAALAADPNRIDLKRELAEFYTEAGNLASARQTLDQILASDSGASPAARDWALTHAALIADDPADGLQKLKAAQPVDDPGRIANLRGQLAYYTSRNQPADRSDMLAVLEDVHRLTGGKLTTREQFQLATISQAKGDWQRAHEIYEEWLDRTPDDTEALARFTALLILHAQDGPSHLTRARALWATLSSLEPDTYRTHALEARLLAAEGHPNEAAGQLSDFVTRFADVELDDLFVRLQVQTVAADAIKLLTAAANLKSDSTVAKELAKAEQLHANGQDDQALAVLKRLAAAQQSVANARVEALNNAAKLIEGFGQVPTAERLLVTYVQKSSRAAAPLELARFLGRQKRFDEALDICRDHWDDIPAETVGSLAAALLRASGTDKRETVQYFVKKLAASIESAPDEKAKRDRLFQLAGLHDFQKNYDKAEAAYSQIIQIKPDDVSAANNLVFFWARRGKNLPQAIEVVDHQLSVYGQSAELLDTKAVVLTAAGQAAQAVEILTAVTEQVPAPVFYLHLAEAHMAAGRAADATKSLQTAIESGLAVESLHPFDLEAYRKLKESL